MIEVSLSLSQSQEPLKWISDTVEGDYPRLGLLLDRLPLRYRRWVAAFARGWSPGCGTCFRCKMPWRWSPGHPTRYYLGSACFPLCERCWAELEPVDRLPFYYQLWQEWERCRAQHPDGYGDRPRGAELWQMMKDGVLAEGNQEVAP